MRSTTITNTQLVESTYGYGNLRRSCRDDPFIRCPGLAESWEVSSDFTQWTFTLRDNILWHDGIPFTPEEAKWWFELSANGYGDRTPSRSKADFGDITSIDILDGNRIRITLESVSPNYLLPLGEPGKMVSHPRHLTQPEVDKGNADATPVDLDFMGTGPFKSEEYTKGSVFSVRRFAQYWEVDDQGRQLPYLDGIDFPIIPDHEAANAAFRAGRLDATARGNRMWWLPEQIVVVKKRMGDDIEFYPVPAGYREVVFNTIDPGPWQDIRVRRAVSLVVDRSAGAQALYGDLSGPVAMFQSTSPWANPNFMEWPGYNPATKTQDRVEAKRLLAEAGFPDGFETTYVCRTGAWVPECEFVAEQFRAYLGIIATLDIVDSSALGDRQCAGTYDIGMFGGGTGSFSDVEFATFASEAVNPCGDMRHEDTHVDDLFQQIKTSAIHEERVRLAREVKRYVLLENVYAINLWVGPYPFAARSYVKGLILPTAEPSGFLEHAWVWLDK